MLLQFRQSSFQCPTGARARLPMVCHRDRRAWSWFPERTARNRVGVRPLGETFVHEGKGCASRIVRRRSDPLGDVPGPPRPSRAVLVLRSVHPRGEAESGSAPQSVLPSHWTVRGQTGISFRIAIVLWPTDRLLATVGRRQATGGARTSAGRPGRYYRIICRHVRLKAPG